jgi:hypothetical protein
MLHAADDQPLKVIPDLVAARGSIGKGTHVFQMELSDRNHPGGASDFEKSWQKFGQLVTGNRAFANKHSI